MITKSRNQKREAGGKYIADTAATVGDFDAIFAHSAAVVNAATSSNITGTLTTVAIPAGATWYGRFSSITLTSGAVTAYNAC